MLPSLAHAGANVVIVNANTGTIGLNDPTPVSPIGGNGGTTLGAQRLIALQYAASIWGAALDSTVEIRIQTQFAERSCTANSAVLASAGAAQWLRDFPNAQLTATWYPVALANKLAGSDRLPASNDINATFNINLGTPGCLESSLGWYYGLDTNHSPSQVNLVSVALHEFAHGLGFAQFADVSTGAQFENLSDVYGRRLFDLTQSKFWPDMTNEQRVQSAINSRRVVWTGPATTAAASEVLSFGAPLLRVTSPPSAAGSYAIGLAEFGPPLSGAVVSGNVVLATDAADGAGALTSDACSPISNGPQIAGKIALVDRGTCTFVVKAKNVQNAGAIAMVVADHTAGAPPPGLGGNDSSITIPSVRITLQDGNAIKAQLANTVNAFLTLDMNQRAGTDEAGRVLMNAPDPVEPGSSISHFDPIASRNQLMEPNISADLTHSVKTPEDLTQALLLDIGWTAPAPPPPTVSPTTLAFGNRLIGYGAFFAPIKFTNSANKPVNIESIVLNVVNGSTEFSRTHDCPTTLAASASCTISVSYLPVSTAQQTTALTIHSEAPGSPHVIAISGTGIVDLVFMLSRPTRPLRGSSGGSSNVFELVVTPVAQFAGNVELTCSGKQADTLCVVQPAAVNLNGAPVTVKVTVKLLGRSFRLRRVGGTEVRSVEPRNIEVRARVNGVDRTITLPVQVER